MSSNHVISNDEYVTSAPMDEVIAEQFASLVDSTHFSFQDLFAFFFSPLSFGSIIRLSVILLLIEKTALRPGRGNEGFPNHPLQSCFRSSENDQLPKDQLLYLVVIFCIELLGEHRDEDNATSTHRRIGTEFMLFHDSLFTEQLWLATNLIFSLMCLGSLLPMAIWCIAALSASRRARGETTLAALLSIWLSYGAKSLLFAGSKQ